MCFKLLGHVNNRKVHKASWACLQQKTTEKGQIVFNSDVNYVVGIKGVAAEVALYFDF